MMDYRFLKDDQNALTVLYDGSPLLQGVYLTVATQRGGCCDLYIESIQDSENQTEVIFETKDRMQSAKLIFKLFGEVMQCYADLETVRENTRVNYYFASNSSLQMHFRFAADQNGNFITDASTKLWFQTPTFSVDLTKLPPQTQDIHILSNQKHVHLFPLISDDFRTEFTDDALVASVGCGGVTRISGYLFTLAVGDDPYGVIERNFKVARASGAIRVPLREERELPSMFDRFGWCTWDAFYQEPTSEKIFQKLDELKALGVKLGYLLIDDGWSQIKDNALWSFEEDRTKFPEGLAACIARIKEEYGCPYVGVWQAFNGYWKGIHPDGAVAKEMGDELTACPNGLLIPSPEAEKSYRFWSRWHRYLADQGVDFVKVDNQTTYSYYIDEVCKNAEGVRAAHEGLERSVFEFFGGKMINCMGMGIYDQLSRPKSALNRNSNDFLPKLENGFTIHIVTNAYNAPVHSQLMYCDYDMWWSKHESAKPSSVLRAISGGPVYISDALGATDLTHLLPLYEKDGTIPKLDSYGMPTYDCFYRDCPKEKIPLKLFNRRGKNLVVAAFGLSEQHVNGTLRLDNIPNSGERYLVREYFSGEERVMDRESEWCFSLEHYGVVLWNLYPIENGTAEIGDPDLYMGCASRKTERRSVT